MTEQHRTPAGVPSGGQFAQTAHAEATVNLASPPDALPSLTSGIEPGRHATCTCDPAATGEYDNYACEIHGTYEFVMRGKGCCCNFGPTTDGPEYDCPVHGAPQCLDPDAEPWRPDPLPVEPGRDSGAVDF